MNHCGTQTIETPRLLLRAFTEEDWVDMLKYWIADPRVQLEYGEPIYSAASEVEALLDKWVCGYKRCDFYRWAIVEKERNINIGQIAFCRVYPDCKTAEVEYCIGEKFWGKGYAPEALSAVIDFIFQNTDFSKLEAYHRMENTKSGRVLEKSVMHQTDTVQRFVREDVEPEGEVCYCITKEVYLK